MGTRYPKTSSPSLSGLPAVESGSPAAVAERFRSAEPDPSQSKEQCAGWILASSLRSGWLQRATVGNGLHGSSVANPELPRVIDACAPDALRRAKTGGSPAKPFEGRTPALLPFRNGELVSAISGPIPMVASSEPSRGTATGLAAVSLALRGPLPVPDLSEQDQRNEELESIEARVRVVECPE